MNNKSGYFITLEGIEGVGKSTSLTYLQQFFTKAKIEHVITREPGGTPIAESIRNLILSHHEEPMNVDTELLLLFASRAQHIASVIKPALNSGKAVLCDRFTDATYAYQGGGRGVDFSRIAILENLVQGDLQPDLTILLNAPVHLALSRAKNRSHPDRIEVEDGYFFERIQNAYLKRAQQYPQRFQIVDATKTKEEVQAQLQEILDKFISNNMNI